MIPTRIYSRCPSLLLLMQSLNLDTYVNVKRRWNMLIGELSTRTAISTRALRHYEKLGLLHSERGENGSATMVRNPWSG